MTLHTRTLEATKTYHIVPARDIGEATRNLLSHGWTRLEYPTIAGEFNSIVDSFTTMTLDANRHEYIIENPCERDADGEHDIGLIEKARGQRKPNPRIDERAEGRVSYDSTKFTHHFKPRLLGYLGRIPGAIDRHARFFLENARMYGELTLVMHEVAQEMDRQMSGYSFGSRFRASDHDHLLRLLRYLCDGPSEIAAGHRDRNFLTAHARSDRSGLWLMDRHGQIVVDAEETRDDSILLFLGRKAWDVTRGKLHGVPHGARDVLLKANMPRKARHTAVAFSHVELTQADIDFYTEHAHSLTLPSHLKAWMNAA